MSLDRFLVFGADEAVRQVRQPVWDENETVRTRRQYLWVCIGDVKR